MLTEAGRSHSMCWKSRIIHDDEQQNITRRKDNDVYYTCANAGLKEEQCQVIRRKDDIRVRNVENAQGGNGTELILYKGDMHLQRRVMGNDSSLFVTTIYSGKYIYCACLCVGWAHVMEV